MYEREGFGSRGGFAGGSKGFSNDRQLTPPVREGEEVDVTIEAVGEKGDGIAKVKGFVIFVAGTKAGERVRIKITRVLQKVGFGTVLGPAQSAPGAEARPVKKAEPEFDPKEELDSENFGDETGEESMGDEPDDDDDEEEEK